MATEKAQQMQDALDTAFAAFSQEHPEVADALRVFNVSYAEYLQMMSSLREDGKTISGNAYTPTT